MFTYKTGAGLDSIIKEYNAELIDCEDGCLLDNYLLTTEDAWIAVLETYAGCCRSIYTVYYGDSEEVFPYFENRRDELIKIKEGIL